MKIRKSFLLLLVIPLIVFICSKAFASWNNNDFLSTSFWGSSPSNSDIIVALFGDGNGGTDRTAYTQNRNTVACATGSMFVVELSPGTDTLPVNLSNNTIYVLNAGNYIISATRNMGTCSALVGKGPILIQSNYNSNTDLIYSNSKSNWILDNLLLDRNLGSSAGNSAYVVHLFFSPSTTMNAIAAYNGQYGILFNNSSNYGTVANSRVHDNKSIGIVFNQSSISGVINNSTSRNNGAEGIYIDSRAGLSWASINNSKIFDNVGDGIGFNIVLSGIVSNCESYGNSGYGIFAQYSTGVTIQNSKIHDNHLAGIEFLYSAYGAINNSQSYNNDSRGVYFIGSPNGGVYRSAMYGNGGPGISLEESYYGIIENSQSYNNNDYGLYLQNSDYGIINNVQSYNNSDDGFFYLGASYGNINNSQSYNNGGAGITFQESTKNTINNTQNYNNQSYGIRFIYSSRDNNINNFWSYNNGGVAYLSIDSTDNKYYGDNKMFSNGALGVGSVGNYYSGTDGLAGRDNGTLDTSIPLKWDFITNPRNDDGIYLLNRSGSFVSLRGNKIFTGTTVMMYSYGSGILNQIQPTIYDGAMLIGSGSYTTGTYIGSKVLEVSGELLGFPSYTHTSGLAVMATAGGNPLIITYSLFGDLYRFKLDQAIDTITGIMLSSGYGTKRIVTQLFQGDGYGKTYNPDDYFATHFQSDVFYGGFCGDGIVDSPNVSGQYEQCDDGNSSNSDFCNNQCQITSLCDFFSVAPLTGYTPFTTTYTISGAIDTGIVIFDSLDFGDGSTGTVDQRTLNYPHTYSNDGTYTGVLGLHIERVSVQCPLTVTTSPSCGNGTIDPGEQCDGTPGCDKDCVYQTPTCTLTGSPLTGFTALTGMFTVSNINTGWMHFDFLNFGDGSTGDVNSGTLDYSHLYTGAGTYTGIFQVSNISSGGIAVQCSATITALPYCGNGIIESGELCDGGPGCEKDCTYGRPDCTLIVSPLTGFAALTGTFTISNINTGWMHFDFLNFGDGHTGNINSGTLNYSHLYTGAGTYTGIFQVSNVISGGIQTQCSAIITVLPRCGNGIIESGEQCDGGLGCDLDLCTYLTPSCSLAVSPLTGAIPLTGTYTVSNINTGWMHFDFLHFGDGGTGNVNSGTLNYSHLYTGVEIYTGIFQVSNIYSGSLTAQCIAAIQVNQNLYCGDGIITNSEQCDDGNNINGDGCSSSCTIESNYCSGVNLYVSPTTAYSGSTTITYTGILSLPYASGYKFITLNYGRGNTRNINGTTGASFHTGIIYHSGGIVNSTVVVQNVYSLSTGLCSFSGVTIQYCGDGVTSNGEQCDDHNNISNDGCSATCQIETNYCSGVNLYVSPTTAYLGSTTITYTGILSLPYASGYKFVTLNYGRSNTRNINGTTGASFHTGILYHSGGIVNSTVVVQNIYSLNTGLCSFNNVTIRYCGDGIKQNILEQCDDGNNINGDGCSNSCTLEIPTCNLTVSPLTGYASLTGIFTISNIHTGWTDFTSLDFGDGTTGAVHTGMLSYAHLYTIPGIYTGILQIHNMYDVGYGSSCVATLQVLAQPTPAISCGDGIKNGTEQCDPSDSTHIGRGNAGCNLNCTPHNSSNGGGISSSIDTCTLPSTLACANTSGIDYSPSYYDNTCCSVSHSSPSTTSIGTGIGGHGAPSLIGIGCKYSDEKYQDNGAFPDSLNNWAFPYIELLRINCIHRGQWDKSLYPYPRYDIPWKYFPEKGATIAAVMKTYVKLLGIHTKTISVTREENPYPGATPFADIPRTFWASRYADTAYKKGLLAGMYETKEGKLYFHPDSMATREEVAAMMMRTYVLIHPGEVDWNTTTTFTDVKATNPYYKYIAAAQSMGFIEGFTRNDGTKYFAGKTTITRSQFAKLVALPFQDELYIDIDATILNSAIYKDIVSAIHQSTSNRIVFINSIISSMDQLSEQYIQDTFKVDKQTFLNALATLLLDNEVN